jgi:hypothetical protein
MKWYLKKIPAWITYPVLVIFSVAVVGAGAFFYVPKHLQAQGYLVGFEGVLSYIEYNCLCSLSIMLTVHPTITRQQGAQDMQLMFYYAPQVLEELGINWEINGVPLPIPRMYLVAPYVAYDQQTLGNYVPGSFPCVAYTGNSCTVTGYAQGAIINIGAAPFPRAN